MPSANHSANHQGNLRLLVIAKLFCTTSLLGLLSACGGGGGSDGPTVSTLNFPLDIAATNYLKSSRTDNLSGSLEGNTFQAIQTQSPGPTAVFEGISALTSTSTTVLRINGALFSQTTSTTYFSGNPFTVYGSINQDGRYEIDQQVANLPSTAKVGAIGNFSTSSTYSDSSLSAQTGTSTTTWSLEEDAETTALFCVNVVTLGAEPVTGSQCYRINSSGEVLGIVVKVTASGKTVILK